MQLPECKSSICACGWNEKHHRRKLQWVTPPRVQGESLPLQAQGAKVRVQGAKVRTSISASWNRMQQQHATPTTTTTTEQLRISTGAGGVHDAAIIATCVRAHNSDSFHALPLMCAIMQVAMIAAEDGRFRSSFIGSRNVFACLQGQFTAWVFYI